MRPVLPATPLLRILPAALILAACSQSAPPEGMEPAAEPEAPKAASAPAPSEAASADLPRIDAPAGRYNLDKNHAMLGVEVMHLGLAGYHMRFTDYDVTVDLDPENIGGASVKVVIRADSIRTDYPGDYKASHADSPFDSWDQALARSDKFLNAGEFPEITYQSTSVQQTGPKTLTVVGDLTLLGQTHPVELAVTVEGALAKHPFANVGALGLSATGTFQRSQFGMDHLNKPGMVGDEVTLRFEGEFRQAPPPEPEAA